MTHAAQYALSLHELEKGKSSREQKALVSSLVALLKRKGHFTLLPTILKEYEKYRERESDHDIVKLFLARESDRASFAKEIKAELFTRGVKKEPKVVFDATLVGGFKLKHRDTVLDASYKTQLIALYQKMISV